MNKREWWIYERCYGHSLAFTSNVTSPAMVNASEVIHVIPAADLAEMRDKYNHEHVQHSGLARLYEIANAEVERVKTLNAGAVKLATLLEQERDEALALLREMTEVLMCQNANALGASDRQLIKQANALLAKAGHGGRG